MLAFHIPTKHTVQCNAQNYSELRQNYSELRPNGAHFQFGVDRIATLFSFGVFGSK